MAIVSYQDLVVWQKGMQLTVEIYRLVKLLPQDERFALQDQMRRAAVSIPSNIAEGQARDTAKSFVSFISIAQGSRAELETQLLLCVRLRYLTEEQISNALSLCVEIRRMLYTLSARLKSQN